MDGASALGWPAFHRSTVHASPLLYDWDLDGTPDILVATYNGEVLAFKDTVRCARARARARARSSVHALALGSAHVSWVGRAARLVSPL